MQEKLSQITDQVNGVLQSLKGATRIKDGDLLVVGTSTSEVMGEHIGTSGTVEIAAAIFEALDAFKKETNINYAFQCCEHLNRSLVVERHVAETRGYDEVTAVPVRSAGGSMAAYAYQKFEDPVMVENVRADMGIDIGDTFIGMHLKPVVVPVRSEVKSVGEAHVTIARTRPKLVGGERAIYPEKERVNRF